MRTVLLSAAFVVLSSHVAGQVPVVPSPKTPPPARTTMKNSEIPVTVEGCIRGKTLTPDWTNGRTTNVKVDFVNASEFSLEGPRELLGLLKQSHDGHQDEITGIAIIPASQKPDGEARSKNVGSRTTVSASTERNRWNEDEVHRSVRLKVVSIRHRADKCSILD